MRQDPSEGDRSTIKSRLLYLLRETKRSSGWVEAESVRLADEKGWKPFASGEVWRMAEGDRGKRPGLEKLGMIADLLGASFLWLAQGKGAPFMTSDPPMQQLRREVADLKQTVDELREALAPRGAKRAHTPVPGSGHSRPPPGHIRAKR